MSEVTRRLRRFAGFVQALLGELSDEHAYRRSLEASGKQASQEEWRRFTEERYRKLATRPKCC